MNRAQRKERSRRIVDQVRSELKDEVRNGGRTYLVQGSTGYWLCAVSSSNIHLNWPILQCDIQLALTWGVRNKLLISELTSGVRSYGLPHNERR